MSQKTEFKIDYSRASLEENALPAIIVAAGSFMRMGGIHKQLAPLCGIPVVVRSLMAYENSPYISGIVLVVRQEDILEMQRLCDLYSITKIKDIVKGGSDRHQSVMNGINCLDSTESAVLIHDGARPLVTSEIIEDAVKGLMTSDAIVSAVKVNDTVKLSTNGETVDKTVDRSGLYFAQTPQGVNISKYKEACERFGDVDFTDDASVMEQAGYSVKITLGDSKNIKITTPADIKIAEMYIKGEEE